MENILQGTVAGVVGGVPIEVAVREEVFMEETAAMLGGDVVRICRVSDN